jgi:hypothetical protein
MITIAATISRSTQQLDRYMNAGDIISVYHASMSEFLIRFPGHRAGIHDLKKPSTACEAGVLSPIG